MSDNHQINSSVLRLIKLQQLVDVDGFSIHVCNYSLVSVFTQEIVHSVPQSKLRCFYLRFFWGVGGV